MPDIATIAQRGQEIQRRQIKQLVETCQEIATSIENDQADDHDEGQLLATAIEARGSLAKALDRSRCAEGDGLRRVVHTALIHLGKAIQPSPVHLSSPACEIRSAAQLLAKAKQIAIAEGWSNA